MATILCYGDSNTHGTKPMRVLGDTGRFEAGQRWPDVMAQALGTEHQVIAEGLPGRTTVHEDLVEGGARNGLAVLPAVLHSHKPLDLLFIMLGTNDLKQRFSVSAFEIARSALRLAQLARAEAVVERIALVAPAPVQEAGSLIEVFAGAESRQEGLATHLRQLAEGEGFGFVDAGEVVTVSQIDGVHWEAEMHAAFGAHMATAARVLLG